MKNHCGKRCGLLELLLGDLIFCLLKKGEVSVTLDKMGSTEYSIGLSDEKSSSRVLKPPGGGHSDIFGSPEVKANPPRPKYNQQNSSNMNGVMGTMDPNLKGNSAQPESAQAAASDAPKAAGQPSAAPASANQSDQSGGRARVPPGGFSSGLW